MLVPVQTTDEHENNTVYNKDVDVLMHNDCHCLQRVSNLCDTGIHSANEAFPAQDKTANVPSIQHCVTMGNVPDSEEGTFLAMLDDMMEHLRCSLSICTVRSEGRRLPMGTLPGREGMAVGSLAGDFGPHAIKHREVSEVVNCECHVRPISKHS